MEIQEVQTHTGSPWGGSSFLLGCTDWCCVFATNLSWPLQPFPAGIFPMVCIFSWTKQMDAMTFLFNTLRYWVWDFFPLVKSGLGNGFVLMVLGQKHAKNRLTACHGHGVIHGIKFNTEFSFVLAQMKFGLLSFIKPGHCESHQGTGKYSLTSSRSLLPWYKFLSPSLYSSKSFLAQSCLNFAFVKSKPFFFFLHPKYETTFRKSTTTPVQVFFWKALPSHLMSSYVLFCL